MCCYRHKKEIAMRASSYGHRVPLFILSALLVIAFRATPTSAQQADFQKKAPQGRPGSVSFASKQYLRSCVASLYSLPPEEQRKAKSCEEMPDLSAKPAHVAQSHIGFWNDIPVVELRLSDGRHLAQAGKELYLLPSIKMEESPKVICRSVGSYFYCRTPRIVCYWYGDRFLFCTAWSGY